jgi:hypothetical protein
MKFSQNRGGLIVAKYDLTLEFRLGGEHSLTIETKSDIDEEDVKDIFTSFFKNPEAQILLKNDMLTVVADKIVVKRH